MTGQRRNRHSILANAATLIGPSSNFKEILMTTSSEHVTALLSFHQNVLSPNLRACQRWRSVAAAAFALLLLLGAIAAPVHAQSVSYTGFETTVLGNGLNAPSGVAVDGAGDVFIADSGNNQVVEIPAGCTSADCQTTVGFGLKSPGAVVVDGAGDVFIADSGNNQVVEIPAGCTSSSCQTTVGFGLKSPEAVIVYGAGKLMIADTGNDRVVVVPVGCVSDSCQDDKFYNGVVSYGLAVDGPGDLFIEDQNSNDVLKIPFGCHSQSCVTTVGYGLDHPFGVAVDGAGNIFIGDSFNSRVVEDPNFGNGAQITVSSDLNGPTGVAVDGVGDVFIADTNNNRVVEVQHAAANFGNVNVCPAGQTTPAPCSQTVTLNYFVTSTTTFGTPAVVTQGASNLDFTLSNGGTCTGTVTAFNACTLNVTFAPLAPGVRLGAVNLFDNSGNLLVTTPIHGIGQGPAIAFGPGVQTTLPTIGLNGPTGVAVDAAGDVFISNPDSHVLKVTPSGTQTLVAIGLNNPSGVAVDGAGDVFIADTGNSQVVEASYLGNGTYHRPVTVPASGLHEPQGVAVDGAGDVFIADAYNRQVVEVPYLGNGTYGTQITVPASGLDKPSGVAVDGAGDVFIADTGNSRVVEVPYLGNGTYGAQITVPASGLSLPYGVAVDEAGDVFIADSNISGVVEVPYLGNGTYGTQTTVGSGLSNPNAVAVDGAGDVFIADNTANLVVEVNRSQPPSLTFASTPVGQTSSDSPQSVTIQNIGNQPLDAVSPGLVVTGPDFIQVAGTGTPDDCTSTFALTPGETCNLSISFTPQTVGNPLTSTAVFSDNALNASPSASQSIALQGVGSGSAPAIVSASSTAFTLGAASSFTVTTTGFPTPSLSESGALPIGVSFQDNGNGTGTLGGIPTQAGSFSIAFTANNGVSPNATQSFTLTVNKLSTTTSLVVNDAATNSPWAGTEVSGASAYASSTVSSGGGPAPTGTVTYSFFGDKICFGTALGVSVETLASGSVPHSATVGPLSAGIYSFNASYSGDSNYNSSFSGCVSFSVSAATVNVTVGTSPAGLAFSVDGTPYASTQSLTWNIGDMHTIATTSPQFPSAGTQDTFAGWSDSGAISHAVTASASTTSYTANFNTSYQLTTAANPTIGGTVTPASGTYYAASTIVGLTATANANYAFSNWTGNVANANSASTTVTMSGPQSVTANFAKAQVIVSPTSLNFGNVVVGRLSKKVVTMTNTDKTKVLVGPITLSVSLGDPSQFALDHVCPTTLKAGTSCSIGVTFRPDAVGPGAATLNIVTSAPGSPIEVPITAAGIAKGH